MRKARILILEDEQVMLWNLKIRFQEEADVCAFGRVAPALESLKSGPFDAVILDINLREGRDSGLEFLREIRSVDEDLKVIIYTADTREDVVQGGFDLGAYRRFIKSVMPIDGIEGHVWAAVEETRRARERRRALAEIEKARVELADVKGTVDSGSAGASVVRGIFEKGGNDIARILGAASQLKRWPDDPAARAQLLKHIEDSARRVSEQIQGFLEGPLGENGDARDVLVTPVLKALKQYFEGASEWVTQFKLLNVLYPLQDIRLQCPPGMLLAGLKNAVEFCFVGMGGRSTLKITVSLMAMGPKGMSRKVGAIYALGRLPRGDGPVASIRMFGGILEMRQREIELAIEGSGAGGRIANMQVVARMLELAGGCAIIWPCAQKQMELEFMLPIFR